MSLRHLMT